MYWQWKKHNLKLYISSNSYGLTLMIFVCQLWTGKTNQLQQWIQPQPQPAARGCMVWDVWTCRTFPQQPRYFWRATVWKQLCAVRCGRPAYISITNTSCEASTCISMSVSSWFNATPFWLEKATGPGWVTVPDSLHNELFHCGFMQWLVSCSLSSNYLNQCSIFEILSNGPNKL